MSQRDTRSARTWREIKAYVYVYEQSSRDRDSKPALTSAPTSTSQGRSGTLSRVLSSSGGLAEALLAEWWQIAVEESPFLKSGVCVRLLEPSEQIWVIVVVKCSVAHSIMSPKGARVLHFKVSFHLLKGIKCLCWCPTLSGSFPFT